MVWTLLGGPDDVLLRKRSSWEHGYWVSSGANCVLSNLVWRERNKLKLMRSVEPIGWEYIGVYELN